MSEIRLDDTEALKTYINLFKLSKKKYLIGIFQEGITVYKQQIRALNIFHALVKAGKIDLNNKEFAIGIIGAGVAGLSFAAAAAKMDIKVTIFEKNAIHMNMQYGCDTRVIHPNIYDWPNKGSTSPYAQSPILDWKANTASNVAKQIVSSFRNIKTASKNSELKTFLNCKIEEIDDTPDGKIRIRFDLKSGKGVRSVNLLIFATGYGLEKGISDTSKTPSYWRNDEYAQTILVPGSKSYFLSGVGDGGLLDLFRLKVLGFSVDSFLKAFSQCENKVLLEEKLLAIKNKWKSLPAAEKEAPSWLRSAFEDIDPNLYKSLINYFDNDDVRIDNCKLIVHGKEKNFPANFHLDRVSMLNAFMAFLMFQKESKFFQYSNGTLEETQTGYLLNGAPIEGNIVIRHGTDKAPIFDKLLSDLEKNELQLIEHSQKTINLYNNTNLLFGYDSLYSLLHKRPGENFQFYTPETTLICSSFVAVLATAIHYHQKISFPNRKYRICLHRAIGGKDDTGYQQITAYYGQIKTQQDKNIGKVYSKTHGIVGLSFRTGKMIYVTNSDEMNYRELMSELEIGTENSQVWRVCPFHTHIGKTWQRTLFNQFNMFYRIG